MSRYAVYMLIAPLVFALTFDLYHWQKLTWELFGWNLVSSYLLFGLPSMIVACVDSRGLKRKSETRLASCLLTMLGITVVPFALAIPGARFEGAFLLYMGIAAILAAGICYGIAEAVSPKPAPEASE